MDRCVLARQALDGRNYRSLSHWYKKSYSLLIGGRGDPHLVTMMQAGSRFRSIATIP